MNAILLISIGIRLVALFWSLLIWRRLKDWRLAFFSLMLLLMAIRQMLTLRNKIDDSFVFYFIGGDEVPGLMVSILALLAVVFLERIFIQLRNTRQMLQQVVDTVPVRIFWKDRQLDYLGCNALFRKDIGQSSDDLHDVSGMVTFPENSEDEKARELKIIHSQKSVLDIEKKYQKADGSQRWIKISKVPLETTGGEIIGLLGCYEDITRRRRKEDEEAIFNHILKQSFSSPDDFLYSVLTELCACEWLTLLPKAAVLLSQQKNGEIIESLASAYGLSAKEKICTVATADSCLCFCHTRHGKTVFIKQCKQGDDKHAHLYIPIFTEQQQTGVLVLYLPKGVEPAPEDNRFLEKIADILGLGIARHQAEQQLIYYAHHDSLTGLLNRRAFEMALDEALGDVKQNHRHHALCYIDLDQFKLVNDTCNHIAGDKLLVQLSGLFRDCIQTGDCMARLGGDEFGLLIMDCSLEEAVESLEALRKSLEQFCFRWEDKVFRITASFGVVAIDKNLPSAEEAMSLADASCFIAKDCGRNRIHICYPDSMDIYNQNKEMRWINLINKALDENSFCLYAQPIYCLKDENRQKLHYEILLRMYDDKGGLVSPGLFFPAAERYQVAVRIDRWVVTEALKRLDYQMEDVECFSINLSGQSVGDLELLQKIKWFVEEERINPEKICFEITETAAIANFSAAQHFMQELVDMGFIFSLDDFGSGLSSFAYLKKLPVKYLKIDGQFIKDICQDPVDLAMVKSINEVGHLLGKETIAEFVENDDILQVITDLGINYGQGYGLGRPVPLGEILRDEKKAADRKYH